MDVNICAEQIPERQRRRKWVDWIYRPRPRLNTNANGIY